MSGFRGELDPDEVAIACARVRARQLGRRLAVTLVDRELYEELQRFLDEVGFRACAALETVSRQPEGELRSRLELLLGGGLEELR
ncbi:hypothetical protein [Amycolatopsis aidingensis]|uniref:hypothetical protein n=1 Tax=Amycolatopsis aidingensis TaxID=2842453 RepID=UPI001C0BE0EF|nr:hypothetical protein [Amycolatopsis aidingensis]